MKYTLLYILLQILPIICLADAATDQVFEVGFFSEPTIVNSTNIPSTVKARIKKHLVLVKKFALTDDLPIKTIHDAANMILEYGSIPFPPTACFDTETRVYFSCRRTDTLANDFSSGFAIDKATGKISQWSCTNEVKIVNNMTNHIFSQHFPDGIAIATTESLSDEMKQLIDRQMEVRLGKIKTITPPKTMPDATNLLYESINMSYGPVACFEENDMFYFSGILYAKPISDFSCGYAISKKDGTFYKWDLFE